MIFSDETKFPVTGHAQPLWRGPGRPPPRPASRDPNVRLKTNAWGCVTSEGFGTIKLLSENLRSAGMCDIYEESLWPTAR